MTDISKPTYSDWVDLATKETRGKSPDDLVWETPEGVNEGICMMPLTRKFSQCCVRNILIRITQGWLVSWV